MIDRLLLRALCAGAFFMAALGGAAAGDIEVSDGWVTPTLGKRDVTAAYVTITNHGAADTLLSVETPAAAKAEMHSHSHEGGMMRMRRVETLAIGAEASTDLKPGGYHIMLFKVAKPLKPGDTVSLTLHFKNAGARTVSLPVLPLAEALDGHDHHHDHDHGAGHDHHHHEQH